ncbi:MAG: hypothetical protein OZ921_20980 [Sorangiineae bacterium]|nr:hypothetical protein [Sorangiineae bacterium]
MTFRSRSLALVLLGASSLAAPLLAAPRVAFAQEDPLIKMARDRFQEGVRYYDQKQFEAARAAFMQAYALKKHPAVLLNLAQSEVRSGHEADAAKHFTQFLRENTEASAAEKKDAEGGLIIAKSRTEEVKISVDAPGAELFVDGQSEGFAPLSDPIYLMPGSHTIEARKGGKTASKAVNATAGTLSSVSLSLSAGGAAAAAPVAAPAGAPVASEPGGGAAPASPPASSAPGAGDGAGGGLSVDTSGDRESFIKWAGRNKLAWVGGGVTVVGLGVGIGFAIGSSAAYSDADRIAQQISTAAARQNYSTAGLCNHPPTDDYTRACQLYQDDRDAGDSRKTLSTVGFVIAGAAAAGTIVYYFVDSKPKPSESAKRAPGGFRAGVYPVAGPHEQGLGVVGQF